jgi:hypothetical protein
MDVKEAVGTAKAYVSDLFKDQIYSDPLLEEVEFDDNSRTWRITIGFLRLPEIRRGPSDADQVNGTPGLGVPPFGMPRRAYKVVRINDAGGNVVSVRDRD